MLTFRFADGNDAAGILDVYSYYIEHTTVTFETQIPSHEAFSRRVEGICGEYPYIVCEDEGRIVAYAYASRHRERAAYLYDADMSVYISRDYHGRGIGKALYTAIFELLGEQGYYNVYAAISLPNESSVAFHMSLGFMEIGRHRKTGYKHGRWIDLLWLEKTLAPHPEFPGEVKGITALEEGFCREVISRAEKSVNRRDNEPFA